MRKVICAIIMMLVRHLCNIVFQECKSVVKVGLQFLGGDVYTFIWQFVSRDNAHPDRCYIARTNWPTS